MTLRARTTRSSCLIAVAAISLLVACWDQASVCDDGKEIWFQRVVNEPGCDRCSVVRFSTPSLELDTFQIRHEPDYVLDSCRISRVQVHPDAVTLVLSAEAYRPLSHIREELAASGKRELVLIRLNESTPVAVVPAKGLHQVLTLFDFEGPAQIDRFLAAIRPNPSVVTRSDERLLSPEVHPSPVQEKAQRLIRDLEQEFPMLKEAPPESPPL